MVEPIMYMAIGFLVSMLIGLMIFPLVHNRAVRLTTKRLQDAAPVSLAEIQADKDQLRAEFAVAARRLEMLVEQHKSKTTSQAAEIGKKTDAINRMKIELGDKTAAIFALQAREQALTEQLQAITTESTAKSQSLQSTELTLSERQNELARLTAELAERSQTIQNLQLELSTARVTIETLTSRLEGTEKDLAVTRQKLEQQRIETATTASELADARSRVDNLSQRVSDLDRQFVEQLKETETQARRADDLQTLVVAKDSQLAAGTNHNTGVAADASNSPDAVATQLQATEDERARLQSDLAAMRQQAESAWINERTENALLRERINDIAAEVAKLALTLEGPESPIKAILAADIATPARPGNGAATAAPATLADRIRALQARTGQSNRHPGWADPPTTLDTPSPTS